MLVTSLLAGTAEWVVSRRLGHAHVQTALNIYTPRELHQTGVTTVVLRGLAA